MSTMTTQQLADWCAETMGWAYHERTGQWKQGRGDAATRQLDHPYPTNLDGAEQAWRDLCEPHGWEWGRGVFVHEGERWHACNDIDDRGWFVKIKGTGNWTHDLFTLIKLCVEAREGRTT